jgi:CBS domain-containing protein
MLIDEAMTVAPVTCRAAESLRIGVERMLRSRVGSVIVHRDDTPVGIVTTQHIIEAYYDLKAEIPDLVGAGRSWSLNG